jgi:hypothetical protein
MFEKETKAMSDLQLQAPPVPYFIPAAPVVEDPVAAAPAEVLPKPMPMRFARYPK